MTRTEDSERRRHPLSGWRSLVRTVLAVDHEGSRYEAEVDFVSLDEDVRLYRDSVFVEQAESPAKFQLAHGARIEVATTLYGVSRARLVTLDGERRLRPLPETVNTGGFAGIRHIPPRRPFSGWRPGWFWSWWHLPRYRSCWSW